MKLTQERYGRLSNAAFAAANRARRDLKAIACVALLTAATMGMAHAQGVSALLPSPMQKVSTVPKNGDLNPYGVAYVPQGFVSTGQLAAGDLLVSNFNNKSNLSATGSTIVNISSAGKQSLFFQGTGTLGLSTALNVLKSGYVMVGNVPTTDGTCGTLGAGSLIFVNSSGHQVLNYTNTNLVNQPWDSAVIDKGGTFTVFVSNAGNGEIARLKFTASQSGIAFQSGTVIASGYDWWCGPNFVISQTGLGYDAVHDILYVASTGDNAVYAIHSASTTSSNGGKGTVIYQDDAHLHGPNGMILAPNGHLIAGNSDFVNPDTKQPSEYVEFTTTGEFVKEFSVNSSFGGAFGLAAAQFGNTVSLAMVDDNNNSILIWTLPADL